MASQSLALAAVHPQSGWCKSSNHQHNVLLSENSRPYLGQGSGEAAMVKGGVVALQLPTVQLDLHVVVRNIAWA